MKSEKAEIKRIVLDLGEVEVGLTLPQAKKLHQLLDEMFGEKVNVYPQYPIIYKDYKPYWTYDGPKWTCSSGPLLSYAAESNTAKITL